MMVQQHYYTRERRGLFRNTEGYDSIAKSENLSDNFVKDYLHPLCFYDAPKQLVSANEKDYSKFPVAHTCAVMPSGELVLGRTTYVGPDFTGERNVFFTHNYVVPANQTEDYLANINRVVLAEGFVTSYDIELGKKIPEVDTIGYDDSLGFFEERRALLGRLKINEDIFKKIMYAVINSISNQMMVYIILDIEISFLDLCARDLLKIIYFYLPLDIRKRTGFVTYVKEPVSKNYVNILFVEKGGILPRDTKTERDYVIDLNNNRFNNLPDNIQSSRYLNFVWDKVENYIDIDDFFELCAMILTKENALLLETYNFATALYFVKDLDRDEYLKNKEYIYSNIFNYISIGKTHKLIAFAETLMDYEISLFLDSDYKSDAMTLKACLAFAKADLLVKYTDLFLKKYLVANHKDFVVMNDFISEISSESFKLLKSLVGQICFAESFETLFEPFVKGRISSTTDIGLLLKELEFWYKVNQIILSYKFFQDLFGNRLLHLFALADNKTAALETSVQFINNINEALREDSLNNKLMFNVKNTTNVFTKILRCLNCVYLSGIRLKPMPVEQIKVLNVHPVKAAELSQELAGEVGSAINNYYIIKFIRDILQTKDSQGYERVLKEIHTIEMRADSVNILKAKIAEIFDNKVNSENFRIVTFSISSIGELLEYVSKNRSVLPEYIYWALGNDVLQIRKDGKLIQKYIGEDISVTSEFLKCGEKNKLDMGNALLVGLKQGIIKPQNEKDTAIVTRCIKKHSGERRFVETICKNSYLEKIYNGIVSKSSGNKALGVSGGNNKAATVFLLLLIVLLLAIIGVAAYFIFNSLFAAQTPLV